jgi:hypothetical protein
MKRQKQRRVSHLDPGDIPEGTGYLEKLRRQHRRDRIEALLSAVRAERPRWMRLPPWHPEVESRMEGLRQTQRSLFAQEVSRDE